MSSPPFGVSLHVALEAARGHLLGCSLSPPGGLESRWGFLGRGGRSPPTVSGGPFRDDKPGRSWGPGSPQIGTGHMGDESRDSSHSDLVIF